MGSGEGTGGNSEIGRRKAEGGSREVGSREGRKLEGRRAEGAEAGRAKLKGFFPVPPFGSASDHLRVRVAREEECAELRVSQK